MQVIVESCLENKTLPEWGLLEFQGVFLGRDNQPVFEQFMGDLNFNKDGTPFFIAGHHILFGEEVKLSKPFAVLGKEVEDNLHTTKYSVKAIIRRKILFKARPKPIIFEEIKMNNE